MIIYGIDEEKERSEDLAQEKDAEVGSRTIAVKKQEEKILLFLPIYKRANIVLKNCI